DKSRFSRDVVMHGALISEYAPGTKPYSSFFRARNRITSGLSLGVTVIEAPLRSGTRLFVNEAADQGKEVFAVPGNADQPNC
ncbi:DNA-protecting protein DprA, partial [Xanthomonas citri pv. citri]|nr:DNA-protecting protein DprA [Xanthomonas citri pv. citri]